MAEREQPLWHRVYFQKPCTELCRTIGYAGASMPDAQAKIKPLAEKYGKELMAKLAEEIVRIDPSTTPPTARLKDNVRKLCWQLLGPPPEHKSVDMNAEIMAMGERLKGEPQKDKRPVKPNKKPRAKKAPKPAVPAINGTPLMQQWKEARERHPGMLLLFRMGDFFELFADDAEKAANILGLTLTTRDKIHAMAGFPHHALEGNLRKLLKAGERVAVCEQVESNRNEVRREITRVLMPAGTVDETTKEVLETAQQLAKGPLGPDSIEAIPDDALYQREYELRKILDRDKTKAQRQEADALKTEIRRRAKAS